MALHFGECVHLALDKYYQKCALTEVISAFTDEFKESEYDTMRTTDHGVKLLTSYMELYPNEPFEVVGEPEMKFIFQVGKVKLRGKIDLPIRWSGGLWAMEHKTTSRLTGGYFEQFDMDKQPMIYIKALEAHFKERC